MPKKDMEVLLLAGMPLLAQFTFWHEFIWVLLVGSLRQFP